MWERRIGTQHRPVRGWAKDYSCTNLDLTRGLRSEDGKRTDPPSEEPKEQMHLGNASVGQLHQKVRHHGRHQRLANKEERKYLGNVAITSTFNALH